MSFSSSSTRSKRVVDFVTVDVKTVVSVVLDVCFSLMSGSFEVSLTPFFS